MTKERPDPNGRTFIGYRFNCSFWQAYTVFYYLRNKRRDVYINFEYPVPGDFYDALEEAMYDCDHYALVLSPNTFLGKQDSREIDNLLWEILLAKKIERKIVPVMFDNFNFDTDLKNIPDELRDFLKRQWGQPISYHDVSGDLHKLSTKFLIKKKQVSTKPMSDKAKVDLMRLSAYSVARTLTEPIDWPDVRQSIADSDGFNSTSMFLGLDYQQRTEYLDGPIHNLITAPPGGDLTSLPGLISNNDNIEGINLNSASFLNISPGSRDGDVHDDEF